MSVSKNTSSWQPTSSLDIIKKRAALYQKIRSFFAEKNVLEVETPLLCQHTVTDPHIESFAVPVQSNQSYYLQTSPEYAMKRLLAAGSGAIYQITKSFRIGESGRKHNPEFTMLEWYRPDFTHHDLMHEIDLFLQATIETKPADKISYKQLFLNHLKINPLAATTAALKKCIADHNIAIDIASLNHDTCLEVLLSHLIEPTLGCEKPLFLYDFPPSQAALSRIRQDDEPVAERFELYLHGTEIANGFHELTDATEQKNRFEKNQMTRMTHNQSVPAIDYFFIDALQSGLPPCSGVAIGLDRLLMHYIQSNTIQDVITFPFDRA